MTLGNLWLVPLARRCWKCVSDSAGSWSNAPRVEVTRCDVSPLPSWVWRKDPTSASWCAEPGPGGEAALTAEWRVKGLWRLRAHPPLLLVLRLFYFWRWVFSLLPILPPPPTPFLSLHRCACFNLSLSASESHSCLLSCHLLLWRCAASQRGWVHSFS